MAIRRLAVLGLAGLLTACAGGPGASSHGPASSTTVPASTTPAPARLDRPAAVEATLTRVERRLRAADDTTAATLGFEQERAYAALAAHPEWRATVTAAMPADVQRAVSANIDAGTELSSLTGSGPPATTLPSWTIRAPLPEATLLADYHEAESLTGISWTDLAAIHFIESRLGRIVGPSSAGAQGPMQFLPATWATYGKGADIDNDHDAIVAAGRLLAAHGGTTDIGRALLAYNDDTRYTRAVQDYAGVLLASPAAFDGYYQWPVYFQTATVTYLLPTGYPSQPAVRAPR